MGSERLRALIAFNSKKTFVKFILTLRCTCPLGFQTSRKEGKKILSSQSNILATWCCQSLKYRLYEMHNLRNFLWLMCTRLWSEDHWEPKTSFLKLWQNAFVIQLNDAPAQLQTLKEEQAPFNTSRKGFSSYHRSATMLTSVAVL